MAGDFFTSSPPHGDLLILSRVLHDWGDVRAKTILERCRSSINPQGRLLVIDEVVTHTGRQDPVTTFADLNMLAALDGRERSEAEFVSLFDAAGLRFLGARSTSTSMWLLEAAPR